MRPTTGAAWRAQLLRWGSVVPLARAWFAGVWSVLLVLVFAAGALAETFESPWDGPAALAPPTADMFQEPAYRAAMAAGLAEQLAFEARRDAPGAQEARRISRTGFASLGRADALALARARFFAQMAAPRDSLGLATGDRIIDFRSSRVATVVDARGRSGLLIASEPIAARRDGKLARLDLSLRTTPGGFAPANAASDLAIPDSADEYLRLEGNDIGVRPTGAAPTAGTARDDHVFYPEIGPDTDYVASATATGAEVMWQLRSASAPERLGLDLDLPSGAEPRLASAISSTNGASGPRDVEIVRDGEVIETITAPEAFDADGAPVPAAFVFDNGRLVVDVPHRGRDVRYPILVDPEVHEVWGNLEFSGSCGGGQTSFQPGLWGYQQFYGTFTPICGEEWAGSGHGLYIRADNHWYPQYSAAQWLWSAPVGAYIMSVWFDGLRHANSATHLFTGLYGNTWGSVYDHWDQDMAWGQDSHVPNSPSNSWSAIVGLYMDGPGSTPSQWAWSGVRGVNIRLGDLVPPNVWFISITGNLDGNGRSRWFDDAQTPVYVNAGATDTGLGLQDVGVERAGGGWFGGPHNGCIGHRASPCPRSWSPTFALNQLPEGYTSLHTWARDIVDNLSTGAPWTQRIDRTPPDIALTGGLIDHAMDGQLPASPELYVHVTDGWDGSWATQRSGVKRVKLYLDGVLQQDNMNPAAECDSCPRGQTWTTSYAALAGVHSVRVDASDYVGHNASRSFTVTGVGGANGVIDSPDEVDSVVDVMQSLSSSQRQTLWAGLSQASRDYYINSLLPDARQVRKDFGLDSSDATTRRVFSDPTTHGTIAEYGTPMTNADWATVSNEGPPSWAYDGPPNPDVLASTYNVSTDNGAAGADSTGNRGCDPTTETGCPSSSTAATDYSAIASDPVTDDLDAVAAAASSEDAVSAGAASGGFDRYGARADADAHAVNPRSGLLSPFNDSDCTNFVSQVWHMGGGLPMTRGWRIRWRRGGGLGARSYTRSWTLVRDFVDYMVRVRQTSRLVTADITSFNLPATAAIADAIEYDWGMGESWSHLGVVVKTNTSIDNVSQHSTNRRESLWNLGWQQQTDRTIRARMRARVVHLRAP